MKLVAVLLFAVRCALKSLRGLHTFKPMLRRLRRVRIMVDMAADQVSRLNGSRKSKSW